MASNSIVIKVIGDPSGLKKTATEVEGTFSKLKKGALALGAAVGGAFAAQQVIQFGADAVKAAVEDEQSQKQLANALKNTAGARQKDIDSVEDWITKQGRALGVTDDQLRPALSKLAGVTHDVGKAQELASLGMDIAAGSGKSLETVTEDLMLAAAGSTRGLRKYGIELKNADGSTKSLAQIQDELKEKFNGAADVAANTAGGKMQRFKVQMDELKESIGAKLLPVVLALGDFLLTKVVPAIEATVAYVQENWPAVQATIVDTFEKIKGYVVPVIEFLQDLWQKFGDNIIEFAMSRFNSLKMFIQGTFEAILGIFRFFQALIRGDWGAAWDALKQIASGAFLAVKGVVEQIWGTIRFIFGTAYDVIAKPVGNAIMAVVGFFQSLPANVFNALSSLPDKITAVFTGAFKAIQNLWNKLDLKIDFDFSIPGWVPGVGGKSFGVHINDVIPDIHAFAKGGIVTRPTIGLIGEAGPEAVIPLGKGMGTTVQVIVQGSVITERELEKTIKDALIDMRQRGYAV